MELSVIIVNYNVKFFLEQCLHSVVKALQFIDSEIIVVDNNSADGSVQMVASRFPDVQLIVNSENTGFSRANNQAILKSNGRYILLLNPDTVVQEDTFQKCIEFMNAHENVGCLGVKMIDGKGRYLPESKRGLPTPRTAFYKISGLSALFPRSQIFARYYMGHLDPGSTHSIDVVSGAFMFIKRAALEKTGLLDESFFMYGEDIDISFRVQQAGFENIYFPETTIIHYKGESTKRGSINYVIMFYRAMIIFARKHFRKSAFWLFSFGIHLAICFRAGISILFRFLQNMIIPVSDAIFIYSGYAVLLPLWERVHFDMKGYYPELIMKWVVPGYIVIWMGCIFFATGYEKKVKINDLARGVLTGTLTLLIVYALLPENWRFSRAILLMGTLWVFISTILIRYLLSIIQSQVFSFEIFKKKKRILIIGHKEEGSRVYSIIKQTQVIPELVGFVSPAGSHFSDEYIGHINQINEIVRINHIEEVIFCAAEVSSKQIIHSMLKFKNTHVDFKIAPPESLSIIGSNSNQAPGEIYTLNFHTLSRTLTRRKKRFFDVGMACLLLIAFPVIALLVKRPFSLLRNIFFVLGGKLSWVGYIKDDSKASYTSDLPPLPQGVLSVLDDFQQNRQNSINLEHLNLSYAKDYCVYNDLKLICTHFRELGRKTIGKINQD